MRTLFRCLLVAGVVALVADAAQAQRQRPQPGQPGTGTGFAGRGAGNVNTLVLSNEDLQKDVKITTEQKDKFKPVAEKLKENQAKLRELFGGGANADRTKMQEIRTEGQKIQEEAKKLVEDTLTSDQKKRLHQIEIQAMGLAAFSSEEVVKELKITDEQKTKIKEINDATNKATREAMTGVLGGGRPGAGGAQLDPEKLAEATKKSQAARKEGFDKVVALLTDDQKKSWKELVGAEFDVSKLAPARRGAAN